MKVYNVLLMDSRPEIVGNSNIPKFEGVNCGEESNKGDI